MKLKSEIRKQNKFVSELGLNRSQRETKFNLISEIQQQTEFLCSLTQHFYFLKKRSNIKSRK